MLLWFENSSPSSLFPLPSLPISTSIHPTYTPVSTFSMEIDPALLLPPFSNPNLNLRPAETDQSTPTLHPQRYLQYPVLLPTAVQPGTTHSQPPAGGTPTDEQEITPRLIRMEAKCCHLNRELEAAMYISPIIWFAHTYISFQGGVQDPCPRNRF